MPELYSNNTQSIDRFMRRPEVEQISGLGRTRIYELMALGEFPRPFRVGRSVHWSAAEVFGWIAKQKAVGQIAA